MKKKYYYIGHYLTDLKDGGQARNKAFHEYLKSKYSSLISFDVYSHNPLRRFLVLFQVIKVFFFSKKNEIFLHQGSFLVLFPYPILTSNYIRKKVFQLLQKAASSNVLTIEINDLPFEQAIDLKLPAKKIFKTIEDHMYSLRDAKYIFAAHKMALYVSDNWCLKNNSFTTIINGANRLQSFQNNMPFFTFLQSQECKYVYAGSLNKGRQIEELIELFSGRKELLILIGDWGDWLANYNLSSNIIYLGKFDEQHAHFLVSKCDIGLIPYDHSRFYYNICYPTKASFYITAGIPFLCTPLEELSFVFSKYNMVYFIPFDDWKIFMDNLKKTDLNQLKILIHQYRELFLWENVIGSGYILS